MKIYYDNKDPDGAYPELYPHEVNEVNLRNSYMGSSMLESGTTYPPKKFTAAKVFGANLDNLSGNYGYVISVCDTGAVQLFIPYENINSTRTSQQPMYIRSISDSVTVSGSKQTKWLPWRRICFYDEVSSLATSAANTAVANSTKCPFPVGFKFCMGELYGSSHTVASLMQNTYPGTTWDTDVNSSDYYVYRKS